jgi:hypothetical protein
MDTVHSGRFCMAKQRGLPPDVERIVAYVPAPVKRAIEELAKERWDSASRIIYHALTAFLDAEKPTWRKRRKA